MNHHPLKRVASCFIAKPNVDKTGLDEYFADVLPQEKATNVKEVQERGLVVATTGDGVNDTHVLAQAYVGISIGTGTDVSVETANIILVKSNPFNALKVIDLSRATYRKMLQTCSGQQNTILSSFRLNPELSRTIISNKITIVIIL